MSKGAEVTILTVRGVFPIVLAKFGLVSRGVIKLFYFIMRTFAVAVDF